MPGFETYIFHGLGAPKNTPTEIINKLNRETNFVLAAAAVKEKFANLGGTALGGSPVDFAKRIAEEIKKWGNVIRAANIKLG